MASRKTRLRPIWQDSPERCGCRKIRWHGSDACAASGNDGPARHQRRALSSRRPVGRIDSIDSWASRAAQKRATFKAAGCCRVRDRDGIWRRALDKRHDSRQGVGIELPRCKCYEDLADQIRAINFLVLRLTHSTSSGQAPPRVQEDSGDETRKCAIETPYQYRNDAVVALIVGSVNFTVQV